MLKRKKAKDYLLEYLKAHNIFYEISSAIGGPAITMEFSVEEAPDRRVESCVWFYKNGAEVRTYYSALGAKVCEDSEHRDELYRLLNFINARVFLNCGHPDGIYEPDMLYTPRMYLTEDGCFDITLTTMIPYDFWEVAPLETADYITIFCPELLDRLTLPVFGVLIGQASLDEAKGYIQKNLLEEE